MTTTMIMTIRATTSAATTPAMIATLPPDGDVGSDGRSVDDDNIININYIGI